MTIVQGLLVKVDVLSGRQQQVRGLGDLLAGRSNQGTKFFPDLKSSPNKRVEKSDQGNRFDARVGLYGKER